MAAPNSLTFTVPGPPATQGSKSCVCLNGRGVLLEGKTNAGRKHFREWRASVADYARLAGMTAPWPLPLDGAVSVDLAFYLERPANPKDPVMPSARGSGDADKYARAALDALAEARVFGDDAQVCGLHVRKVYGDRPGLVVTVGPYERGDA